MDFFLCIERGRTSITPCQIRRSLKFLRPSLFLNLLMNSERLCWIWEHLYITCKLHRTVIKHHTWLLQAFIFLLDAFAACRKKEDFEVKLKTYWIVQHFAGRRRWPIPFFAQTAIAYYIPETLHSSMIFWRLSPESVRMKVRRVGSYGQVTWLRNERLGPSFGAKPGRARSRGI